MGISIGLPGELYTNSKYKTVDKRVFIKEHGEMAGKFEIDEIDISQESKNKENDLRKNATAEKEK